MAGGVARRMQRAECPGHAFDHRAIRQGDVWGEMAVDAFAAIGQATRGKVLHSGPAAGVERTKAHHDRPRGAGEGRGQRGMVKMGMGDQNMGYHLIRAQCGKDCRQVAG
jgi:hypothetical protein